MCLVCLVVMLTGLAATYAAEMAQAEEDQVWAEPPVGPDGPQRGWRFEPGSEQVEQLLARIRETNPQKADELAKLQQEDPNEFKVQLRKIMREHFAARMRENQKEPGQFSQRRPRKPMAGGESATNEAPRTGPGGRREGNQPRINREQIQQRHEEYLEWLGENLPDEAAKLTQVKEETPDQYIRALALSMRKNGRIYWASKDNPELASALKEGKALKERRMELLEQIKTTTNEDEKKALATELEDVVSRQFDLIVLRKQITYENLAKKLEELQKEVDQKKVDVEKWKTPEFKNKQIKQRVDELINQTERFEWD